MQAAQMPRQSTYRRITHITHNTNTQRRRDHNMIRVRAAAPAVREHAMLPRHAKARTVTRHHCTRTHHASRNNAFSAPAEHAQQTVGTLTLRPCSAVAITP